MKTDADLEETIDRVLYLIGARAYACIIDTAGRNSTFPCRRE